MRKIASNDYYNIQVEERKNRLYLSILGFWSNESQVPDYIDDLDKALKCLSRGYTIITDIREMKTPSQEIGELHIKAQKIVIGAGLSKTAEIHPASAIAKMSVDRFSNQSGMIKGMFPSIEDAEKWLDV